MKSAWLLISSSILAGCLAAAGPDSEPDPAATTDDGELQPLYHRIDNHARVCDDNQDGMSCLVRLRIDETGRPALSLGPAGYGANDLQSAYKITTSGSSATTIAIVAAFGYPNAENDLLDYRGWFGLPACTTLGGCFRKVDQNGGTSYPAPDLGWEQETALDLDMASAMCPDCKILLVEAASAGADDIVAAVDRAAAMGAHVISNSYAAPEAGTSSYESHYNHPGVAVVAGAGDSGYGVEFPAASPHVIAVGGTSLKTATNARGWTETAWSGTGAGCSAVYAKPSWQHDTGCSHRTVADVAAVADPNTGVAIYGPASSSLSGWLVSGGTSVATPVVAGIFANNGGAVTYASEIYAHPGALFDVVSGKDGTCSPSYLCTAGAGYDGPTGLGTPDGTSAF